tara:strand:+ start:119 stop:508 length:390 start_codon:yes stop_codon:yes gene_type:complete
MIKVIVISVIFINSLFSQWKIGEHCTDGYVLYPKIEWSITNGSIQQTDDHLIGDFNFGEQIDFKFVLPLTKTISFIYATQTVNPFESIYYRDNGSLWQGKVLRNLVTKWNKSTVGISINFHPNMLKIRN